MNELPKMNCCLSKNKSAMIKKYWTQWSVGNTNLLRTKSLVMRHKFRIFSEIDEPLDFNKTLANGSAC